MATTAAPSTRPEIVKNAPPASERLTSLDLLRGATIAGMILVNNAGDEPSAYWPLKHAEWNGWTPTDLVFPFFLFMVGVAMTFSLASRLKRGDSRESLLKHILIRGLILFAIGVALHGIPVPDFATIRIYGVLQRIAICYVIAGFASLWVGKRGQWGIILSCLVGYWIIMRYVPVPGFGIPTHDMPLLDPDRNIVAWLDRKLMMGHLYEGTRDPEGLISTIPAIATALLGVKTGQWLRSDKTPQMKAMGMAVYGVIGFVLGEVLNLWFPINKKLWTSSFVVLTAGLALICFAICYWLVDIKKWKSWTKPFLVFGSNAIAAYVVAELGAHILYRTKLHLAGGGVTSLHTYVYEHWFVPLGSPANASLAYAVVYVAICWLLMLILYRKKIFIKV
jgi:predicted acyltransferase